MLTNNQRGEANQGKKEIKMVDIKAYFDSDVFVSNELSDEVNRKEAENFIKYITNPNTLPKTES